ncbi:unnamed protein product, partial [Rotaria magnacalcarata]
EIVDQSIIINKGMDGGFAAQYAINEFKMKVTLLNTEEFVTFEFHPDDQVEPIVFRINFSYVNEENEINDENFKKMQAKFDKKMFSLNGNIPPELNKIKSSILKSSVRDLLISLSEKDKYNGSGTTV